jgi:pyruvate dehydrogenase E2 component (dihydrolipoamide acetyltransferase)
MAATQTVDVVMPQMGVSVSEGTITRWLKQVGEKIEADESLLEISTDKVDTEVPSPGTGVVAEILVQEGETVDVGTRLAVIAPEGAEARAPAEEAPPEPATQEAAAEAAQAAPAEATPPTQDEPAPAPPPAQAEQPRATAGPSSRRWSLGSRRSTASTRVRCPAPAAGDA